MALQGLTMSRDLHSKTSEAVKDSLSGNAFCQPMWLITLWAFLYSLAQQKDDTDEDDTQDAFALLGALAAVRCKSAGLAH